MRADSTRLFEAATAGTLAKFGVTMRLAWLALLGAITFCGSAFAESWICVRPFHTDKILMLQEEFQVHGDELWQFAGIKHFRTVLHVGINNPTGITATKSDSWVSLFDRHTAVTEIVAINKRTGEFLKSSVFVEDGLDLDEKLERGKCRPGH